MVVQLRGHSQYSLLRGLGSVEDILQRASDAGYSAVGVTDYDGMYGVLRMYTTASNFGIQPILGVELAYEPLSSQKQPAYVAFLASSTEGYQTLLSLTSYANMQPAKNFPTIDDRALEQYNTDIIALVGGPYSRWYVQTTETARDHALKALGSYIGKENIYLDYVAQSYASAPRARDHNSLLATYDDIYPTVIHNHFHYLGAVDAEAFATAVRIKRSSFEVRAGNYHIMDEAELIHQTQDHGKDTATIRTYLDTNQQVADQIQYDIPLHQTLFPNFSLDDDITALYEKHKDYLIGDDATQ